MNSDVDDTCSVVVGVDVVNAANDGADDSQSPYCDSISIKNRENKHYVIFNGNLMCFTSDN